MAVKTYGIFVAYSPHVRLRSEGLGRYLAAFVKAAAKRTDIKLVIAAPSWSRTPLRDLFSDHGVPESAVEFVGPARQPVLFHLYRLAEWYRRPRQRRPPRWIRRIAETLGGHVGRVIRAIAGTRNPVTFALYGLYALALTFGGAALAIVPGAAVLAQRSFRKASRFVARRLIPMTRKPGSVLRAARGRVTSSRLYSDMLAQELDLLVQMANTLPQVEAWYAPTSLWPAFNRLKAPRLCCFPDLVVMEFPVAFADPRSGITSHAKLVRDTVGGGQYFVTYSEHIKRTVMIQKLGVLANRITVVPHAPNSLSSRVEISGFSDNQARSLCLSLTTAALKKASGPSRGQRFDYLDSGFLFYASQFRPSKNVITLLRAYEFLLRRRYIGHKLILTGDGSFEPVADFIRSHRLERDVLCLHNLSEAQLAAFYRLAALAVNPSLSEGGMPFTFTEAVSVGTPVVMGDIPVTREVLTEPTVVESTLFDPYDWQAVASKIEWALNNREALYDIQRRFYDTVLARRTWDDVVAEHLAILEDISRRQRMAAAT